MFKDAIDKIKLNKERKLSGEDICIPFPKTMPRFSKVIPGILKGKYWLISAPQKIGKSSIANYIFLYHLFTWLYENKDQTNIEVKMFYVSLEISKSSLAINMFSHLLFIKHKLVISAEKLQSYFNGYTIEDSIIKLIEEEKEFLKFVEERLVVIEDIRNPFGIYKTLQAHFEANGTWTYITRDWTNEKGELEKDKRFRDKYIENNENLYTFVLVDHLGLLEPEKGDVLHDAIQKFSSNYCIKLRNKCNAIIVNVQQMNAALEDKTYNNKGTLNIDKLKPNPANLSDNKATAKDIDYMISLFHPFRYGLEYYKGFNLIEDNLGDHYRELIINLNRHGSTAEIPYYFLGASCYFKEFPDVINESVYEFIRKNRSLEENHFNNK